MGSGKRFLHFVSQAEGTAHDDSLNTSNHFHIVTLLACFVGSLIFGIVYLTYKIRFLSSTCFKTDKRPDATDSVPALIKQQTLMNDPEISNKSRGVTATEKRTLNRLGKNSALCVKFTAFWPFPVLFHSVVMHIQLKNVKKDAI